MPISNVCVINPYLPTMGGGEKHMGYFLQFIENRYQTAKIDILVFNYNDIDVHSSNYVTIDDLNKKFGLNLQRTEIVKVDINPNPSVFAKAANKKKIENLTKGYDLLINAMFLSKHIGRARINFYMCMFPPKPFVLEKRKGIPQLAARVNDSKFYQSYDKFISNSDFTNHWLTYYWGPNQDKYRIIYAPVFTEQGMSGRYNEENKRNSIISVGRFFAEGHCKRQLDMVRFFVGHQDVFHDFEYHLVGVVANYGKDLEYFNSVCELANTVDNVFIHRDCPFDELMELYKQSKFFWHATGYGEDEEENPERMEHFGITTVEAMSYGVVPVVINKGGQRETVTHGKNGFLWDTEQECVDYTDRLIRDDQLRIAFAQESVIRAAAFSIDEFYRQNERLFDECGL